MTRICDTGRFDRAPNGEERPEDVLATSQAASVY